MKFDWLNLEIYFPFFIGHSTCILFKVPPIKLSDSTLDDLVRRYIMDQCNDNVGANAMKAKQFGQDIKV
jgi:hypothetical protein